MIHNFNAGPSHLPAEVLEEAQKAIINFKGSGLSILEIGHRTPLFEESVAEARALVRELMQLDDDHEVLFLHGGATTQFMQVPMNLLDADETMHIAHTGVWSKKAIREASCFGKVNILCSSENNNFNYIPEDFCVPESGKYFHITSNNTIYGTQWHRIPESPIPLVADMSSDILSRRIDFNAFELIYAGAQKNIGVAGATLVVVNKKLLGNVTRDIPPIMDYREHIKANSMLNTPPVFAIYMSLLTLRWLKKFGGIEAIEPLNKEKAALLYDAIDNSSLFRGTAKKEDRSTMNVSFVATNSGAEKAFLDFAKQKDIYGIKGHRLVGGFRASLYNAVSLESVKHLISVIKEFESGYNG
ncbi:MAG: 3-phosphoserine/phosphohydroxythreonine transaminase [Chitinophagaceae bacterium]|nr:3-phosphoserine/phosphohydroxythreonine transaminase [Chitinophagaceae bacterium]